MNLDSSLLTRQQTSLIHHCIRHLQTDYDYWFRGQAPDCAALIAPLVKRILGEFILCDNLYHDLEHTVQVTLVGKEILNGQLACGEHHTPQTWLNFITALLCHDLGYLKGICLSDQPEAHRFAVGATSSIINLPVHATGASLTPYHVDRSQQFVAETLSLEYPMLDHQWIQYAIEQTRFPVVPEMFKNNRDSLAELIRAADLIGQLADPTYLMKLPLLFREFEETGTHQVLGCKDAQDLRTSFPSFYWKNVSPYVMQGIRYLEMSQAGQAVLANLYNNRIVVEKELDQYYGLQQRPSQRLKRWFLRGCQSTLHQRAGADVFI